ncbi:MAG: S9 family peptidase [Acidimicrobiales bacterium]
MSPKRGFVPDDVWRLRAVSDPQVSPDGSSVAFVVATPDRDVDKMVTTIWVAPADGSLPARAFTSGPEDSSPRWSPDGCWLAFIAERGHGPQLHLAPLGGGEAHALTEAPHGVSQPAWALDGRRLAFVARTGEWKKPEDRSAVERSAPRVVTGLYHRYDGLGSFDARRTHLFVIGVDGGEATQVTDGDYDDADPAWSPDSRELAFVSDRSATRGDEVHRDVWVVPVGGAHRPRRLTRGRGTAASPRWSPDGATIAYVGHEHADGDSASDTHLLVVAVRQPRAPRSLSSPLDRTVWGLMRAPGATHVWTEDGSAVLFVALDRGALSVYRVPLHGAVPALVLGGDRQVTALHVSRGAIAFTSQWPSGPPEVFCADIDGTAERRISDVNAEMRSVRWAPVRRTHHKATDGRRVESFVMYPPGYAKGHLAPMVLEIHGGPHSWHPQTVMLPLYQSLAAAGYVVVLPNPRGSHGYGEEYAGACVGDWGGADFEDLMGAVDQLVESGVADPERLYVAGYSYGGFMASWAVGHTGRFAAACVSAPVADLASLWGTTDIPNFTENEMGALPWERPDVYARHSPVTYLPSVHTPVQLFHWEGDMRCPIGQAEELFQGLRKLGREVVMVRYPGGFHIVRSPSQLADFVTRHLDWFTNHTV